MDTIDSFKDNITILKSFITIIYVMPFSVTCQINKSNNKNWIEIISYLSGRTIWVLPKIFCQLHTFCSRQESFHCFFCYRKRRVPITCIKSVSLYDVQLILYEILFHTNFCFLSIVEKSQFKCFFLILLYAKLVVNRMSTSDISMFRGFGVFMFYCSNFIGRNTHNWILWFRVCLY